MAVSDDRKYTKEFIYNLLEGVKGKTLGEVDVSQQFKRTKKSPKITGIAGDVVEQSIFRYERDREQECDIEIDGVLTELKTTGVRIPKSDLKNIKGKTGDAYNVFFSAKEGISITAVTFNPTYEHDFLTSHFWAKSQHLLIVFYEYKSYEVVPAADYAQFPIVGYCYNSFSDNERAQLQNDWEIVRNYLADIYAEYPEEEDRNEHLVGFTHVVRPNLMLIEIVPAFKKIINRNGSVSFQKPRYRLKQTFVDYIVKGHFRKSRIKSEIKLKESFNSFADLDHRCHLLTEKYKGHTFVELQRELNIQAETKTKDFGALCILKMFDADCKKLNQISDFTKVGILAKTIKITPQGTRTEDMKLSHIDFEEWADRDVDFEDSAVYAYFCEHSFLCPIFCEHVAGQPNETTFEGFKRFSFDQTFIENEVQRTWKDSRALIHNNELEWEYVCINGIPQKNKSGSYQGAPNFPKSSQYKVFFRGGGTDSSDKNKTECVNGIFMLPQYFWLKGVYIAEKLKTITYL